MTAQSSTLALRPATSGRVTVMIVARVAFAVAALSLAIVPALAAERLALKGDVTVSSDVLTLGDLVAGAPESHAMRPLFRSPALGETGTIQAQRIVAAASALGLSRIETGGRQQVTVTRAARRITTAEIENAVKRALELQHGIDSRPLSIAFDGAPNLVTAPDVKGQVTAEDVTFDRRTRRVSALVSVGTQAGERRAATRVAGAAVELVEVAVLNRSLNRGEAVQASDFSVERRTRETLPSDVQLDASSLVGQVARRALSSGSVVRTGDLAQPEIVARGEMVTVVYEMPGMMLTLRGRANEAGAKGDTISILNLQSKKNLHAQITGPGRVSVASPSLGPVASARP